MYKIMNNLCSIPFNTYFSFTNSPNTLRRNSLQICYKYHIKHKTLQWSNIFFNGIVNVWNGLPDSVVTSPLIILVLSSPDWAGWKTNFKMSIQFLLLFWLTLLLSCVVPYSSCQFLCLFFSYFLTAFLLLCTSREQSYIFQLFHTVFIFLTF